jgi:formylglycine-generating enzyme required for sulfatase activity
MTRKQKIIKTKVGFLELGKQLGNVSKAGRFAGEFGSSSPQNDPPGHEGGSTRVVRGGSWGYGSSLRVSYRHQYPVDGSLMIGFRCAG